MGSWKEFGDGEADRKSSSHFILWLLGICTDSPGIDDIEH
jgi:hypothetical protein